MEQTTCTLCYGTQQLSVDLPTQNLIGVLSAKRIVAPEDETELIRQALAQPIHSPRLGELAGLGMRVTIVTDDMTRPTPTHKMLPEVLKQLTSAGVKRSDITLIFATGSHRSHTEEEIHRLTGGPQVTDGIRIVDHNAQDKDSLIQIGVTSRGTPVEVNRALVDADLKILFGLIKPHCVAGYTGGGKSILPGVSGMDTIISDHNYQATAHEKSILGVMNGNPIRQDIEEAAGLFAPVFILNVILNDEKKIIGAVAGDMIEAHRAGTKLVEDWICAEVTEQADLALCGCSYPSSVNLYQAATAPQACTRTASPVLRKGGICIVAAPCTEGIGGGPFHDLLREATTPEDVLLKISAPGFFQHDQWAAQLWVAVLLHCDVYLVADGMTAQQAADMKCKKFSTVEEALEEAYTVLGSKARTVVVEDAPYLIPLYRGEGRP